MERRRNVVMSKVTKWLQLVFVIHSMVLVTPVISEGVKCGRPGRPTNGTLSPPGKTYFPGEKVSYSCLEGFILFGQQQSTCLKNGTWSGDVPLCDFNLAKGKKGLQSDTLWSYNPDLAVDGNADTCSFTPRGPEPRWWQVHLGHKYNIVSVGVTISPGSLQEFTIYVIELLADNKALYKPCTTFKGVFQTHKGLFKCNDGLGHPGQFVYIKDDRKEQEYFGLCEVEVFAFRERIPCGDPETPVHGQVTRKTEGQSEYTCERGFKLEGDTVLQCSSKGKWQGHPPRCIEVKCDAPPHTEKGYIEIGNPKGEYIYGTEARYGCSPGHKLSGNEVRVCDEKGQWSGSDPTCQAVSCGDPPTFPNTKHTFINGTNPWTAIAVYTCIEGYQLIHDDEDTITTCLDSGEWRFLNVTCVPNPLVNAVARQGHERSLNYEIFTENRPAQAMPHVILILAVLAGVLATTMVIGVVILVRKRFLSGMGSLSPLMRHIPKNNNYGHGQHQSKCPVPMPHQHNSDSHQSNRKVYPFHGSTNDQISLTSQDTCYEKIHNENNYETLNKKSSQISEAAQENPAGNSDEMSYTKDVDYEIVHPRQPVDDNQYETVQEKEPGYETIQNGTEPGYETVEDPPVKVHGYETIKPKLPPPNVCNGVPDILQNIQSGTLCPNELTVASKDIPPEVLALYARVDKSKKTTKKKPEGDVAKVQEQNTMPLESAHSPLSQQNSLASQSSLSSSGTLRPLPPIPTD